MRGEGPGYTSPCRGVLKARLDGDSGSPGPWEVSLLRAGRDGLGFPVPSAPNR